MNYGLCFLTRNGMGIRRIHIVGIAGFVFLLILLDQLYLFYQLSLPRPPFAHSLHVDDVRQLVRASDDADVTTVLFDSVIVEAFHNNAHVVDNPEACVFLCHVIGPLIFAANYNDVKKKPMFTQRLAQLGFTVTLFDNGDGDLSHIFLVRTGSPLHIVLLHWKDAGYFRQYAIKGPPIRIAQLKQFITKDSWRILSSDRAYPSLTTKEVFMDTVRIVIPSDVPAFVSIHSAARFVECNQTRARYYRLRFPEPHDLAFEHAAYKLISTARAVLDELGVPFWLSSGTLLGYFRQCAIFSWAQDVDLGVFIEDYVPDIIPAMERRGFKHKHTFGKLSDSYELSFTLSRIKLDIFFFYKDGAVTWNGSVNKKGEKFKYVFPSFSLCWTEFLEMLVRVPCNTEEYIVANYGPNWFTPVRKWSYTANPPNALPNGRWLEHEWPQVMLIKQ